MNLEEKAILADQVIEPFDLVQLQQNDCVTCEASVARFLPERSEAARIVTGAESSQRGC